MVDTDDTRRTTYDGRRTTDDGRRTTPRVWHKLPTGELKNRKAFKYMYMIILSHCNIKKCTEFIQTYTYLVQYEEIRETKPKHSYHTPHNHMNTKTE